MCDCENCCKEDNCPDECECDCSCVGPASGCD